MRTTGVSLDASIALTCSSNNSRDILKDLMQSSFAAGRHKAILVVRRMMSLTCISIPNPRPGSIGSYRYAGTKTFFLA